MNFGIDCWSSLNGFKEKTLIDILILDVKDSKLKKTVIERISNYAV